MARMGMPTWGWQHDPPQLAEALELPANMLGVYVSSVVLGARKREAWKVAAAL
jgi:hypothetical protein